MRLLLADVEAAAEEGDIGRVKEALSPEFRGGDDLNRQTAIAMLLARTRGGRSIHVLTRILGVVATPGAPARAELLVAMAAVPIPGVEALENLQADVYRFEVTLVEDPDGPHGYRVMSATWAPARWGE